MPAKQVNNKNRSKGARRPRSRGMRHLPMQSSVPAAERILMTYSTNNAIVEGAAGTGVTYFYSLNSVYDPDVSGVGTSATGYSTWAARFYNYRVRAVTVRFKVFASGSTGGAHMVVVAPLPGGAVAPSNPELWRSIRGNTSNLIASSDQGGANRWEFTKTYDMAHWLGITKQQFVNEQDYAGQIGSSPARTLYLLIGTRAVNGSTPSRIFFSLDITYQVEWFNPTPMQL